MAGAGARRAGSGLILGVCFLIAGLEGYDIQSFGVAAPRLAADLGLHSAQLGWGASAAMVGLVLGALAGGIAADRVGRKPVLLVSVLAFGLFSVATSLVHAFPLLLLTRFATGVGFGGALPNLIAIATEISPPGRRAATVTTIACGMPAGGAVVSLLARLAGAGLDWRAIFLAGGLAPLVVLPAVYFLLPETRPAPDPAADRRLVAALFGTGRRAAATLLLWIAFLLTLVVLYLLLNWLPTLVIAKGLSPADGAAASLSFNLVSIPGAMLLGVVADRFGFRAPLLATYLALAATMEGLAYAHGAGAVLALAGAAGFLVIGAQYVLYALAPTYYPPQLRAAGAGAAVGVGRLGSIAGPLLAGQLREAGASAADVLAAMLPVALLAGACAVLLTFIGRAREEPTPEPSLATAATAADAAA
jgi:AAHS family 3-hydroxyphenylpropionic acid transporter